MTERRLVNDGPVPEIGEVSAHATRCGYRLVRDSTPTDRWLLLDLDDDECLYSALTLDGIEQYLNE
ncbi:hypothetical protein [Nocardia mexicana]|uniref:Uncharacterized protein n=1 Tax=Nocardia mexicana TaxID=279262 RepID=A0A370H2B0_9NOCA|nr:hypothetical protein [Nocardia mexicana]RDI49804.1 hypothetical protein DFR68_106241 [Nocardia mexicana]